MYGGIKPQSKEQSEDPDKTIQEIKDTSNQNQKEVLLAYCQIAMSLANNIVIKNFFSNG
jgi:hypothetical protein